MPVLTDARMALGRLDALRAICPHSERSNTATFLEECRVYVETLQKRVADLEHAVACSHAGAPLSIHTAMHAAPLAAQLQAQLPAQHLYPATTSAYQHPVAATPLVSKYQQSMQPPALPPAQPPVTNGTPGTPCGACGAASRSEAVAAAALGAGGHAQAAGQPGTPPAVSGTGSGGESAGAVVGASLETSSEDSGIPLKKRRVQ